MNMLSTVTPWDSVAAGYAETAMRFFQAYVKDALRYTELKPDSQVLDIACGPGTLALNIARQVGHIQAIDFSENMLAILDRKKTEQGVHNIETTCADAQQLPYPDNSFDIAFSIFGLMFFPDRGRAYSEILRTLKPGGQLVLSSWAPTAQSPLMQAVFGALRAINPAIPEPKTVIDSLENPEFFKNELETAGFREVQIQLSSQSFPLSSIEQFWSDMVRGNAPLVMLKNSMSEAEWQEKNQIALDYLEKTLGSETSSLSADAWLGIARK